MNTTMQKITESVKEVIKDSGMSEMRQALVLAWLDVAYSTGRYDGMTDFYNQQKANEK